MKRFLQTSGILLFLALATWSTAAQTLTTVTGTILDVNGIPYGGARVAVTLNSPGGPSPSLTPCNNPSAGCQIQNPGAVTANAAGGFTINLWANASILPAGTSYSFTITESPGVLPPWGTGPQTFTISNVTIAGASQSLTATITAANPLALTQGGALANWANLTPGTNTHTGTFSANGGATQIFDFHNATLKESQKNNCVSFGGLSVTGVLYWDAAGIGYCYFDGTETDYFAAFIATGAEPNGCVNGGTNPAGGPALYTADTSNGNSFPCGTIYRYTDTGAANALVVSTGYDPITISGLFGTFNAYEINVIPANPTTSATPTLNFFAQGAATITKCGTAALISGDITTTAIAKFIFDGTHWQLQNPQAVPCGTATTAPTLNPPPVTAAVASPVSVGTSDTTILTASITMPASGCPCRVFVTVSLYLDFTTSISEVAFRVNDGTNNLPLGIQTGPSNASGGARTSAGVTAYMGLTYANSTAVTFTLIGAGSASGAVVESAPDVGTGPNSSMQIAAVTSN